MTFLAFLPGRNAMANLQAMLQAVRGTRDLLPEQCRRFRAVENLALEFAERFGFEEIQTPIIESSAVFKRTLGDTSDIVTKEMYAFTDLGGDELVLRPEGTAGVARAFISEGLQQNLPLKLFYRGPMFRYERPQRGRYRQFYQMGVELLGIDKPQADIEVIALAKGFLDALKLNGKTTLHINTIGDTESRTAYRSKLVEFMQGRRDELSSDSLARLERNPLRILDTKDPGDRSVLATAPLLSDSLNETSRQYFADVCEGLKSLDIDFVVDPVLVRGLDYYCHVVFEFQTDALGAQNAICSGGRYDGLISDLGGAKTPGVGWAAGTDRLVELATLELASPSPIALVPMGEAAELALTKLAYSLRLSGMAVELGYSGNLQKRMKRADKLRAKFAVIVGDNEITAGVAQVKRLATGEQHAVPLAQLPAWLASQTLPPTLNKK